MSRPRAAAPVEEGIVAALNHEAAGIVRGGKTVFVHGALPGERVRFRRTHRHRQHDEAQLLEVIEPAADRSLARCEHFGVCGGCALQHFAPEAQLAAKQRELADSLERIARAAPSRWLEPLAGPQWEYRRRARLAAKWVPKKGRVVVGFRERLAPYVADVVRCHVLAPPVGMLIEPLSRLLSALSIRDRVPQIEVAVGDAATVLVMRVLAEPSAEDRRLMLGFEVEHGVRLYLQTGGLETVAPLAGDTARLAYRLAPFDVEIGFEPTDFVQVNAAINAALVERVVGLMAAGPDARILDLFCGLGNFTLPLARRAGEVVGVEGEAGLVARARANAAANGLENVQFHLANLADPAAGTAAWARERYTHVLLDPPRAGAREIMPTVAQIRPRTLMYISCHPGSLARDIGVLVHEHGFALRAAGVVDMFPHTTHVESLAVLEP